MPRTATDIQNDLDAAYAARLACLNGQSVSHDGSSRTRASLAEINRMIDDLESELAAKQNNVGVSFTPTMTPSRR